MLAAPVATEARIFPATPRAVTEMDSWIESIGERWGVDQLILFRARVCVSELAGNVLAHGRTAPDVDSIILELRHTPPGLEIELSDSGAAFDPATAPAIEPDADRIGGRGLRLVRAYAQVLAYRRNDGRNVVTLQLAPASA
jgi:anti-sigma regulatory factor (Ser/Thr protein kinase)